MKHLKVVTDFILKHFKTIALLVILMMVLLFFFKKESPVVIPGHKKGEPVTLKENEREIIGIVGRKLTIVRRAKDGKSVTTTTRYIPPDGGARITIKDDGSPSDIYVKTKGFSASPGIGISYSDSIRLTLDLNVMYWNRLGLNVGAGIGRDPFAIPFVAINYGWGNVRWQNTALMAGYALNSGWLVGMRVRF